MMEAPEITPTGAEELPTKRQIIHSTCEAIGVYATETAGTVQDLDPELELAAIDCIMRDGLQSD